MGDIGLQIISFDQLDSTSNYIAKAIESRQYAEGTVILAHFQHQGRGQRGSNWQSNAGENITFSFGVNSDFLALHTQFLLAKAISIAIVDFLKSIIGREVYIKWPNDILAGDAKIAGLLIETVGHNPRYSIVGIGLNVNQLHFAAPYKATSIRQELGAEVNIQVVLNQLLGYINQRMDALIGGFELLIDADYMTALHGNGRWINVVADEIEFAAMITQVDNSGVIYMKNKAGRVLSHRAKEIKISF